MFATGAYKDAATKAAAEAAGAAPEPLEDGPSEVMASEEVAAEEVEEETELPDEEISEDDPLKETKHALKSLRMRAKDLLEGNGAQKLSAKQKIELRGFAKQVRTSMSKPASVTPSALDDLSTQLETLSLRASGLDTRSAQSAEEAGSAPQSMNETNKNALEAEKAALEAAVREAEENPFDASKPYATPWRPRPYFSAFAFIPRYLEVNQNICSAVYLRHPVCYPGFAEVPTPFAPETGQLAFNWYLRRS